MHHWESGRPGPRQTVHVTAWGLAGRALPEPARRWGQSHYRGTFEQMTSAPQFPNFRVFVHHPLPRPSTHSCLQTPLLCPHPTDPAQSSWQDAGKEVETAELGPQSPEVGEEGAARPGLENMNAEEGKELGVLPTLLARVEECRTAGNRCPCGSRRMGVPWGGVQARSAPLAEREREGSLPPPPTAGREGMKGGDAGPSKSGVCRPEETIRGRQRLGEDSGTLAYNPAVLIPPAFARREPSLGRPSQDSSTEVRASSGQSPSGPPAKGPKTTASASFDGTTPGHGLRLPKLGLLTCATGTCQILPPK
uniref:uncharacterized protein LOC132678374 n=1 Tax=Panthera onca TaxID=9690 RepID=UPI002954F280|nr:uncharacterized protein LOC132678374 [Panthera onca]